VTGTIALGAASKPNDPLNPTFDTVTVTQKLVVQDSKMTPRIVLATGQDLSATMTVTDDVQQGSVIIGTTPASLGGSNYLQVMGRETGTSNDHPIVLINTTDLFSNVWVSDGSGNVPCGLGASSNHSGIQVSSRLSGQASLNLRVDSGTPRFELHDTQGKIKGLITTVADSPNVTFQPTAITGGIAPPSTPTPEIGQIPATKKK